MITVGIDASSSIVGIVVLNDTDIVFASYADLRKAKKFCDKTDIVKDFFYNIRDTLLKQSCVNFCYIEECVQRYTPGMSSAKTIIILARINGAVSVIAHEAFSVDVNVLNASHARKLIGCKVSKRARVGRSTKDVVRDFVIAKFKLETMYRVIKHGPRAGQRVIHEAMYDIADACTIAQAGLLSTKHVS